MLMPFRYASDNTFALLPSCFHVCCMSPWQPQRRHLLHRLFFALFLFPTLVSLDNIDMPLPVAGDAFDIALLLRFGAKGLIFALLAFHLARLKLVILMTVEKGMSLEFKSVSAVLVATWTS